MNEGCVNPRLKHPKNKGMKMEIILASVTTNIKLAKFIATNYVNSDFKVAVLTSYKNDIVIIVIRKSALEMFDRSGINKIKPACYTT